MIKPIVCALALNLTACGADDNNFSTKEMCEKYEEYLIDCKAEDKEQTVTYQELHRESDCSWILKVDYKTKQPNGYTLRGTECESPMFEDVFSENQTRFENRLKVVLEDLTEQLQDDAEIICNGIDYCKTE